jgi:hypothetical protein
VNGKCFVAGTSVHTESGVRPVESVKQGDRVWAYDLFSREWLLSPVYETRY